jgi:cytochrome P450
MEIHESLNDPEFFAIADYHAALRELRHHDPVHWGVGRHGWAYWSVTRYEDCQAVYRDPETFCSSRGIGLPTNPPEEERKAEELGGNLMMIQLDPPRHTKVRQVFKKWFTPLAIARMEADFRAIAAELIDAVAERGSCDLVVDLAARMPTAVICQMLAVPKSDWNHMINLGNRSVGSTDPEYQNGASAADTARQAQAGIFQYFGSMLGARRARPGSDLVSVVANCEVEGKKLDDREVLADCFLLLLGGLETTRNAISGGVLELMRQHEQRELLLSQPQLINSAVEEILRWTSPIAHIMRTATRDTELAGRTIKRGQKVAIWNASANRDELVFSDPYRFDITRSPNYHLAFGYGEHFCLGSNLARLEIKVMVEEILRRLHDLELDGEVQRLRSCVVAGIKHLPVNFSAVDAPQASAH